MEVIEQFLHKFQTRKTVDPLVRFG